MTRITELDCVVIGNLVNTHTHIPAPGVGAIGTAVADSSRYVVSQQSPWSAGAFSRDDMFRDQRGRGLTGQSVGPFGDATMTTVMSTNCVDFYWIGF